MSYVFLTGATGYLGRCVLEELRARGRSVVALVRTDSRLEDCRSVVGNLANPDRWLDEVAGADGVIHLASPRSNTRETVLREDVLGTAALLDRWRHGNCVYASSQTVYGIPRQALTESCPLDASCWYDFGKVTTEFQLGLAERRDTRGAAVSLRLALVFGGGARRGDRQFLAMVHRQCERGATFVFDSNDGMETYGSSFIGRRDAARSFVEALTLKESGPYNVAGGFCTWRQLIDTINRCAGTRAKVAVRPGAKAETGEVRLPQSRSILETGKFDRQATLGATQTLEEAVEEFVKWEHAVNVQR